jgi:hypothetical protein
MTEKGRKEAPSSSGYAVPKTNPKVKDNEDHYPINDLAHGRNALARVHQYDGEAPDWWDGTLTELITTVETAVHREYPGLAKRKAEREGKD